MTLPTNEQFDELDELHARILGRSKFCRCRGEVKTPDLLDECAAQHIADAKRIAELEMEIERLVDALAAAEQACVDRADRLNDFGPESECCAATARNCAADVSDCGKAAP